MSTKIRNQVKNLQPGDLIFVKTIVDDKWEWVTVTNVETSLSGYCWVSYITEFGFEDECGFDGSVILRKFKKGVK